MTRRRYSLISLVVSAVAVCFLGAFIQAGTFASYTASKELTGSVAAGEWMASITVKKVVDTSDTFAFGFGQDVPAECTTPIPALGDNGTHICNFSILSGAAFSITEEVPDHWQDPGIDCTGTGEERVSVASPAIEFDLEAGDDVTCTFTNTRKPGTLVVVKQTHGGDATFGFGASGIPAVTTFNVLTTDGTGSKTFDDLAAGSVVTISEQATAGWSQLSASCAVTTTGSGDSSIDGTEVTIGADDTVTCTFVNSKHAELTVTKTYSDSSTGPQVSIGLSGEGCTVQGDNPRTTAGLTATFTIIDIPAGGVDCTVNEISSPTGYTPSYADCGAGGSRVLDDLAPGGSASCTIHNVLNSATVTVSKAYSPTLPGQGAVTVTLSCGAGTIVENDKSALPASPAVFTVTGIPEAGTTCTASEDTPPAGYTAAGCDTPFAVSKNDTTANCTITNTANSATFTVTKQYDGPSAGEVSVTLNCSTGYVYDASTQSVNGTKTTTSLTAVFTVRAVPTAGTTCTATEQVPDGYASDHATACADVSLAANGTAGCTITNTANTATFTVNKSYVGTNAGEVTVDLSCNAGTITAPASKATSDGAAVFTVRAIPGGSTSCTATEETGPADYSVDESDCASVNLTTAAPASCTIVNTQNATLTVVKAVSGGTASAGDWQLSVKQGDDDVDGSPQAGSASGSVYSLAPGTYTISESGGPTDYTASFSASCPGGSITLAAGQAATCTVTNTRDTGSVTIVKNADGAGTFGFNLSALTSAGGSCPSSSITVTGSGANYTGSITCTGVQTGTYTISENAPGAGWNFENVSCGGATPVTTLSVSVTVTKDQNVECVFTNKKDAPTPSTFFFGRRGNNTEDSSGNTVNAPMGSIAPSASGQHYRLVQKGGSVTATSSDQSKYMNWKSAPQPGLSLTSSSTAQVRLWLAMKDNKDDKEGHITVFVRKCDQGATPTSYPANCSILGQADFDRPSGTAAFTEAVINIQLSAAGPFDSDDVLEVKVIVRNSSDDDMWVGFDTTSMQSRMIVTP